MQPSKPIAGREGTFARLRLLVHRPWFGCVTGGLLAAFAGFVFYNPHLGQGLINASYDLPLAYHAPRPPEDVVVVYVDEESREQLKQPWKLPWDRSLHARLLERLTADGARAVAFDFIFSKEINPERPGDVPSSWVPADPQADAKFAAAIRAHGRVVIGSRLMRVGSPLLAAGLALETPADVLAKAAAATGVLEVESDMDTTVRRLHPVFVRGDGTRYTTLDWETARLARPALKEPAGGASWWVNYYGPPGTIRAEPYHRALRDLPAGYFKDKAVLVGEMVEVNMPGAKADTFRSPFLGKPRFNGVEVHATILQNLIRNEWLRRGGGVWEVAVLALLGMAIGGALPRLRPWIAAAAAVAAMLVVMVLAFTLHWQAHVWFPWLIPVAVQVPVALVWSLSVRGARVYLARVGARHVAPRFAVPELEGQTMAGFKVLELLGKGGMGAVYRARQPALKRFIALKVLPPFLADDAEFVSRFRREAAAAANLSHPNLVQVYTAGVCDGTHYIAMELVDGEPLRARLTREGRIAPADALAICRDVAEALKHAWERSRLIHRDIKPGNIFLAKTGEVKLGDLGLAKTLGGESTELTETGAAVGSPHYISPEQAEGSKEIDFRADIYSLGCTLYHLLTGQTPYEGDNSVMIMASHVTQPPPDILQKWPACPMPLALLLARMLKKKPRERHASYEELIAEIRAVREQVLSLPKPPQPPPMQSDSRPTARI